MFLVVLIIGWVMIWIAADAPLTSWRGAMILVGGTILSTSYYFA